MILYVEMDDDAVYFSCRRIQLKRKRIRRRKERDREGQKKKLGRTVEERFLMVFDFEKLSEPLPILAAGSMLLHRN